RLRRGPFESAGTGRSRCFHRCFVANGATFATLSDGALWSINGLLMESGLLKLDCRALWGLIMASMSTSTQEYMEAIEHLPRGATLILQKVSCDDYEALTYDLMIAGRHARVSYDHGRVEIVSPLNEHESYCRFIDALVRAYDEHLNVKLETAGHKTRVR